MRLSQTSLIAAILVVGSGLAAPVFAQGIGGGVGGGGSSIGGGVGGGSSIGGGIGGGSSIGGGIGGTGTTGGIDTSPGAGSLDTGIGSTGSSTGGLGSSMDTTLGDTDLGSVDSDPTVQPDINIGGSTSPSGDTTQRATEGSSSIGSINSGDFARGESVGTSAVTSFGEENQTSGSSDLSYTPGAGSRADYNIPNPPVGIDLGSIRAGLRGAPSATPNAYGD